MSSRTDFVPKRRLISNVTISTTAEVTTTEAHGYETGYVVRVFVPAAYGMSLYQQATIAVTGANSFLTNIDTSSQLPFVPPTFTPGGVGFTDAQVIPMSGVEDNALR